MKTLIPSLFIFLTWTIYAQEDAEYRLTIDSRGMTANSNYALELIRSDTLNLLIVQKEKPGNPVLSKKDSSRVLNLLEGKGQLNREELSQIIEKNREYLVDSLTIRDDHPILQLTDSLFRNRKRIKRNLKENEDKRIILDGSTVKLSIDDFKDEVDEFYLRFPTRESHPEINRLISQVIEMYIQEAESPILDKGI